MTTMISKLFFSRWIAFGHDVLCIPISILLAYWLRFNLGDVPPHYLTGARSMLLVAIPVQAILFWVFGFYRGYWRFASIPDLVRIIKSVAIGAVFCALIVVFFLQVVPVPRTVVVLYPILLVLSLSSSRILYRYLKDHHFNLARKNGKKALIVGAGRAGDSLARDLLNSELFQPMGFLDDDVRAQGREIRGVRVLGTCRDLESIIKQLEVQTVLLAIPSAARGFVVGMISECARLGVKCKTLPSLLELTGQKIQSKHLRDITVDDLLGRDPVKLDDKAIDDYLAGKSILVTGGGGSIGSELCRQIAKSKPKCLIIFDHSEFNLYAIELELLGKFPDLILVAVLGDVKVESRVTWVFKEFKPEVVFHAAAYKHVPMVEKNPVEGVCNNVVGTRLVADAADRFGVRRFVLVSTDKAVNPANVMGATKRVAEVYCQNLAQRSKTKFITTRFGNVLGSAGSVVPLFEQQIKAGGPITVTHKEITRYFMTIPESVGLILQAGAMGKGGEIFVLEMGEPVLIRDLAEQMIRLSGLRVGEDIQIHYTGLRPGEKLYEEVFHLGEGVVGTEHPKLQLAQARLVDWEWLVGELNALEGVAYDRNLPQIMGYLKMIVPEYTPGSSSVLERNIARDEDRLIQKLALAS